MNLALDLVSRSARSVLTQRDPVAALTQQPMRLPRDGKITVLDAIAARDEAMQDFGRARKRLAVAKQWHDNAPVLGALLGFVATTAAFELKRLRTPPMPSASAAPQSGV